MEIEHKNGPGDDPDNGGNWEDGIKEELRMIMIKNAKEVSRDREKWTEIVVAVMDFHGF